MIQKAIPGYTELFGQPIFSYEDLLKEVSPHTGILYCISLNNELQAGLPYEINQARLMNQAQSIFTPEQKEFINTRLFRLAVERQDRSIAEIFYKSALLAMLVKELNRAGKRADHTIHRENQFPLMLAYLLVIDEENAKSRPHLDDAIAKKNQPLSEYRIIWEPLIRQYLFQEWVSPIFEVFKVGCLFKYSFENWRTHLKNYLSTFGIQKVGDLVGSYKQLIDIAQREHTHQPLRKFTPIRSKNEVKHLQYLSVNSLIGKKNIEWPDLKKRPLYYHEEIGYLIIDKDFLFKHIYRGTFFDLRSTTALKSLDYGDYSTIVSTEVMEKIVLRAILSQLQKKAGLLIFDTGPDAGRGVPDAYYRHQQVIFLFESKATIFRDDLATAPNFDDLVDYLQERLIENEDGKPKGVGQLIKNIETIVGGGYSFDRSPGTAGKLTIYPILLHNDFQFSLPGINNYLNDNFRSQLKPELQQQADIRDLTFINIDWLFDLSLRDCSLLNLQRYIDRYHELLKERKNALLSTRPDGDQFLRSHASFDEIYQFTFIKDLPDAADNPQILTDLLFHAGLTQDILDVEV